MQYLKILLIVLLLCTASLQADLQEGDTLPNPTLKSQDGKEFALHDLLGKVTIIHLWKCN
ncbi:MAG: hypothetical protein P9X24_06315 [Candidatus Hatepunaea meridiana]|nr:hypothetical protein [Candidatus Hatepunaea meridiana]